MTTASSTPRFTVTGQTKTTILNAQNQAVQVWQVSFVTPLGDAGVVDVPVNAYTPENVSSLILAQVDTLNAVRNLG